MKNIDIKTDGLELVVSLLNEKINSIEEIFNDIDKKMLKIDGTSEVWQSTSQDAVYKSYKTISNTFPNMVEQLTSYKLFLEKTIANYKKGEADINKEINDNENNLDVN